MSAVENFKKALTPLLGKLFNGSQPSSNALSVVQAQTTTVSFGQITTPVANTDLLTGNVNGWFDAKDFRSGGVTFIGAGTISGTVVAEQTNDITNAAAGGQFLMSFCASNIVPTAAFAVTSNSNTNFEFPITARYIRFKLTANATGAGSIGAVAQLSQVPHATSHNAMALIAPTTAFAPSVARSSGLAASLQGKASAAAVLSIHGYNSKASLQYIQIYNLASAPADGVSTAVEIIPVPAKSNFSFSPNYGSFPELFSAGVYVCNSSTETTKTIGSADCLFTINYS